MAGDDLEAEQRYVTALYERLDLLRDRAAADLDQVRRMPTAGTPGARSERDAFAALHAGRLAQLRAVEDRLAFGRLDLADGAPRYIGRLGLSDDDHRSLLMDWRAPAAEAFYQATAANPAGVVRRRHLSTRGRLVTGVEDEVLDLDALPDDQAASLQGEGALLAALTARRTGQMRDIVATIQAEQDRVIRSPLQGVLVVQGGPGTGKTAVALHRAAYLLYTYRDRVAKSGVLLVGPNRVFLRYIEQVLPSLGETGVVMATPGQLYPGIEATGYEAADTVVLKGDRRMAKVLAGVVASRQRVPSGPVLLNVDGTEIILRPSDVEAARARARRSRKPHNAARVVFVKDLLDRLARQLAAAVGKELGFDLDGDSHAELVSQLRESVEVRRQVNRCWLPLTPPRLLTDFFANPGRYAADLLSPAELALLHRPAGGPWTTADVPLLDEAAELLGEDDTAVRAAAAQAAAERKEEMAYAGGVLQLAGEAAEMMTTEQLAERYGGSGPSLTAADRARDDRTWAFGHLVVDEAQELSQMMWRLLRRRCPTRSMTVVGDIAQTGSPAGAGSWDEVLDRGRWRLEELTVNYRTPGRIMRVASDVLAAGGVSARAPRSARDGDWPPVARLLPPGDLAAMTEAVRTELTEVDGGTLAVVTSRASYGPVVGALTAALPAGAVRAGTADRGDTPGSRTATAEAPDAPVSVFTVTDVKGLEFDTVVIYEPAEVLGESPRGVQDLYVALTRPTRRLLVLHTGALPAGLASLADALF